MRTIEIIAQINKLIIYLDNKEDIKREMEKIKDFIKEVEETL